MQKPHANHPEPEHQPDHGPVVMAASHRPGLVPVVVAVTGHRHLAVEDLGAIEQAVRAAMIDLQKRCPHSPFWLMSGLAEGADSIAARCALELGWQVHAVMPVSLQDHESSLSSAQARETFHQLHSRCASLTILPLSSEAPDQKYLDVANYLCQQGQWLIAVWDGKPAEGPGGTADVVRLFQQGMANAAGTLPDTGPVIHIRARRQHDDFASEHVGNRSYRWPNPLNLNLEHTSKDSGQWWRVLARIDDFNLLARHCLDEEVIEVQRHRQTLGFPESETSFAGSEADRISWIYAVADRLSLRYQSRRMKSFLWMLCFSLLAIVAEQLYTGPLENNPYVLALTIFFVAMAVYPEVARRLSRFWGGGGEEAAYLDCRALAEACRVQYYWRLNGMTDSTADVFLAEQRDELEWIRQALRSTGMGSAERLLSVNDGFAFALQHWIIDQRKFFIGDGEHNSRALRNLKKAEQYDRTVSMLLFVVLGLLCSAVVMHLVMKALYIPLTDNVWLASVQMGWGVALGAAATVKLYHRTLAHHENARRYERMGLLTRMTEISMTEALSRQADVTACRDILRSYGWAALRENEHWLTLLRSRPSSSSLSG
jgi:hypothetical protein